MPYGMYLHHVGLTKSKTLLLLEGNSFEFMIQCRFSYEARRFIVYRAYCV